MSRLQIPSRTVAGLLHPITEHAKYKPDCPFVIAQQQAAALKASNGASTQRNANHQCCDPLTQPSSLEKLQTQAKRDAEEINKLKAEVQTLVKQRDHAKMGLAVQKDGRQEDLDLWKSKIEDARADVAVALASKKTLDAAYATSIHELIIELKALKYMAAPFQSAKGTFEAAHAKEVQELKTEIKALTTSVTPLQAAIEGLAASITRLQVDKVAVDQEAVSEMNGNDQHAVMIGNTPTKASIDKDSLFSAAASPNPSDRLEAEDVKEEVIPHACEQNFDSECEGEAEVDNAAVDDASVHTPNQDDSSSRNADADGGNAWSTIRDQDASNNNVAATEDSLNDKDLPSDDSWFDLESLSPSSNGPESVDSE